MAQSLIPETLNAVDKTMEETILKFAKSHGVSLQYLFCLVDILYQTTNFFKNVDNNVL